MIELVNVTKKFDDRGIAGLNGVSLKLTPGEIMAIMGPNGSGKTTLINIIAGLVRPDQGEARIENAAAIFSGIPETLDMNVQKYLIQRNEQDIEDEKKFQLARDFADIFEFTFQLRQNLSQLSQGQRQKVALAAHLVNRPGLLLLDEPFAHLDPHTRKDILKSLFAYIKNQETSLLWVTHELDEALLFSDRLGILHFGKFEQVATPYDLVIKPRNLFVAQFLGFENFFAIKGNETPWGVYINSTVPEESLLVVPAEALAISTSGIKGVVTSHLLKGNQKRIIARYADKDVQVTLKRSEPFPPVGSEVRLEASLKDCFVIPL